MAFQKEYTVNGFTYPEAYFRLGAYQFNKRSMQGQFIIDCYASRNARDQSLGYVVTSLPAYQINRHMTERECYEHCLTVLEGEEPKMILITEIAEGQFDENGDPLQTVREELETDTRKSFFADAEIV